MTTSTRFHADHQLDQVAAQFEHWRQHRAHRRERIPTPLWDHAVALTALLPPSRVAAQLRLGATDLKKQIALRHDDAAQTAAPGGFVEVPPPLPAPHVLTGVEVEIHRTDGARLRLHVPAVTTLPLATLVQSFLEAR